ncbi:MAG: DUF485 domain-containing protein [Nocardioides sp.]|nr:DUF485 domain-containing protein [Nocardioides sp.]
MPTEVTHHAHDHAERHDPVYDRLAATPEFAQLRQLYRGFVFPATIAFLAWYLLYILMSNWATGFMNIQVIGNINVALVFGLLQFATTFGLAWLYSRFSNAKLDPLARRLNEEYEATVLDEHGKRH